MKRLALTQARIINPGGSPVYLDEGIIVIKGDTIESVGQQLPAGVDIDETIDLRGKTVLPGMINLHTHLYSALALGMPPPPQTPTNFVEILERIWWRLDLALDEESTRASFESGLLACLRAGVTTVFDHHSSQNWIAGSLAALIETASQLGVNLSPAFEVTDRNGPERFRAGLEENLATIDELGVDPTTHPMLGLHASFTLSDESLSVVEAALRELPGVGVHIHVSEDQADEEDARGQGYTSVVDRLDRFNLLTENSLIAHGLHITPEDAKRLADLGVAVAHNPSSNANNRVGSLPVAIADRLPVGLGTDGMQADMLREAKEGSLIQSSQAPAGGRSHNYIEMLFRRNPEIAGRFFSRKIGLIEPGYQADLAIYDYHPRTQVSGNNLAGHLLYGLELPCHVLSRGKFRVRDNRFVKVDEERALANAARQSARLWETMAGI